MLAERQSGLTIVGRFNYLHEADLAKALLASEGIASWLLDEHQIRQRWHLGAALGGVKLAVAPEHAWRARQILDEDHSEHLAAIPEQELPPHPEELCPRCGAEARIESSGQRLPGPFQWLVSLAFLVLGVLVPRRRFDTVRCCEGCGHRWSRAETR